MDGLNQVTLIGSVGKDAEVTLVGEGSKVAKFSLATNRSYKDKSGVKQTKTEWHNVEVWAETANFAGEWVKKGKLLLVIGEIRYEKFEDKEGKTQYRTKIFGNKIQLFPKGGAETAANANGNATDAKKQTEQYANEHASAEVVVNSAQDEDLPF